MKNAVPHLKGVLYIGLQLAISHLAPRVLGIPLGEIQASAVELVLKSELPSGLLLGQARQSNQNRGQGCEQLHNLLVCAFILTAVTT